MYSPFTQCFSVTAASGVFPSNVDITYSIFRTIQIFYLSWFYLMMTCIGLIFLIILFVLLLPPNSRLFNFIMKLFVKLDWEKELEETKLEQPIHIHPSFSSYFSINNNSKTTEDEEEEVTVPRKRNAAPSYQVENSFLSTPFSENSALLFQPKSFDANSNNNSSSKNYPYSTTVAKTTTTTTYSPSNTSHRNIYYLLQKKQTSIGGFLTIILGLIFVIFAVQTTIDFFNPTKFNLYPSLIVIDDNNTVKPVSMNSSSQVFTNTFFSRNNVSVVLYSEILSKSRGHLNATFCDCQIFNPMIDMFNNGELITDENTKCEFFMETCVVSVLFAVPSKLLARDGATSLLSWNITTTIHSNEYYLGNSMFASTQKYFNDYEGKCEKKVQNFPLLEQYLYLSNHYCFTWLSKEANQIANVEGKLSGFVFGKNFLESATYTSVIPYSRVVFFPQSFFKQEEDFYGVSEAEEEEEGNYQFIFRLSEGNMYSLEVPELFDLFLKLFSVLGGIFALLPILRSVLEKLVHFYMNHVCGRIVVILLCLAVEVVVGVPYFYFSLVAKNQWQSFTQPLISFAWIVMPALLAVALLWNTVCYHRIYARTKSQYLKEQQQEQDE